MPLYDTAHRLNADLCTIQLNDSTNQALSSYMLANHRFKNGFLPCCPKVDSSPKTKKHFLDDFFIPISSTVSPDSDTELESDSNSESNLKCNTDTCSNPNSDSSWKNVDPCDAYLKHQNLRAWDGYGTKMCKIDEDNYIRINQKQPDDTEVHNKCRRIFTANPKLKINVSNELEMGMKTGDNSVRRGHASFKCEKIVTPNCVKSTQRCIPKIKSDKNTIPDKYAEHQWDVYHPIIKKCSNVNVISPENWIAGGASSRNISRTPEFIKMFQDYSNLTNLSSCV